MGQGKKLGPDKPLCYLVSIAISLIVNNINFVFFPTLFLVIKIPLILIELRRNRTLVDQICNLATVPTVNLTHFYKNYSYY